MLLLLSPVLIFVISILNLMLRKCLNAPFGFWAFACKHLTLVYLASVVFNVILVSFLLVGICVFISSCLRAKICLFLMNSNDLIILFTL